MKNPDSAHMFNLSVKIYVEDIKKSPSYWYYTVVETNKYDIKHWKVYHSTNYLAIQRHRRKLVESLDKRRNQINRGAYNIGFDVKPTLLERIRANKQQKVK